MSYTQKYYKELFLNLLTHANEEGLISHNELFQSYIKSKMDISSFYVMTLSILADSIEDVYYDMTTVYESSKVVYALGEDLDDIGDIVGCRRPQATRSCVELTITLPKALTSTYTLPANVIVSDNRGVQYATAKPVPIPIGVKEFKAYAVSLSTGLKSHVEAHTLTSFESELTDESGVKIGAMVTNEKSSFGGHEIYTDNQYRELLMKWVNSQTRGSREAYEKYFATVDGVNAYKLIPNWNGVTGTVKIVIEPGYSEQLQECYEEITSEVCQFSEDIVLYPPDYIPIDIYATCDVDLDVVNPYSATEKEELASKIRDYIRIYIDGDVMSGYNGLAIGEDFIPYKLGVFLSNNIPELKNVKFNYPLNPVTITDEEMAKSQDIHIKMGKVSSYNGWDTDNDGDWDIIAEDDMQFTSVTVKDGDYDTLTYQFKD